MKNIIAKGALCVASFMYFNAPVFAQKGLPPGKPVNASVATNFPQHLDFSESMLSKLKAPQGFKIGIAATGLGKPRMMAIADDGTLYVTRRDAGDILMLRNNSAGKFKELKTAWANFPDVHGITIHDGMLYACSSTTLKKAKINADGSLSDTVTLVKDLPEGSQHNNRMIAFGADGLLYMTVGSSCNDCGETNPEHATMLVMNADGSKRRIFARGLRNTIGFDWQPETNKIWGCDNGTDWRGDEIPPEELNQISEGKNYGWPLVFGKQQPDYTREEPPGYSLAEYARSTEPSVMEFPAHSAPIDFRFLTRAKTFPADFRDDALVCWHGSWNRNNPEGYKVQRILFEKGRPVKTEDFFSGFLSADGKSRFGRPAGLAISGDGTLYISDDENGVIYSVTYSRL